MTKKARFFLIFLILTLFSCKKEFSSPELEAHFTETQIKDLNEINNFFISEFLKSDKDNFKSAFLQFKDSLKFNGEFSKNDESLFKNQLKLYESISQSTFNEIWELKVTSGLPYPDEEYISAKVFGKYYSFLNEISDSNKFAKICYNRIEMSGVYNPIYLDSYFYYDSDNFNYDDFHNQLILSIYYLTALDNYERDSGRKKRFKEFERKANLEFEKRKK